MKNTRTKLEILASGFFCNLPENFALTSYYHGRELLTWHITCEHKGTFSFLFGGIDYQRRDLFDSYYNNLLGIIQEGMAKGYRRINLGQTAEQAKMRVGGQLVPKLMFLHHKNRLIRMIVKLFRNQLEYRVRNNKMLVFKYEYPIL
jgi:hypothetical protein